MKEPIHEYISRKLNEKVDSLVFQEIRKLVNESPPNEDGLQIIEVRSCPHCQKQYLGGVEKCVWYLEKFIDENIVVYKHNKEITYALESELI